jgi:hypothetical protein
LNHKSIARFLKRGSIIFTYTEQGEGSMMKIEIVYCTV